MTDINDILQAPDRVTRRDYLRDVAIPAIEQAARDASQKAIEIGAAVMVEQPWRIGRAIYGIGFRVGNWDKPHLTMLLAKCRDAIAGEVKRAQEGHWTADPTRLVGLRQAELALVMKLERRDYR